MTNKKGRAAEGYLRYPGLFVKSLKMESSKAFRFNGVVLDKKNLKAFRFDGVDLLQHLGNDDNSMVIRYLRQQVSDNLCFAKFSVDFFPKMWYNN